MFIFVLLVIISIPVSLLQVNSASYPSRITACLVGVKVKRVHGLPV